MKCVIVQFLNNITSFSSSPPDPRFASKPSETFQWFSFRSFMLQYFGGFLIRGRLYLQLSIALDLSNPSSTSMMPWINGPSGVQPLPFQLFGRLYHFSLLSSLLLLSSFTPCPSRVPCARFFPRCYHKNTWL